MQLQEMRNSMGRSSSSSSRFESFTWIIEDFSNQNIMKLSSKAFKIRGYTWKIRVERDMNHFSLFLMVADSLPPYGWTRNTFFKLALINQFDRRKSIVKETQQKFKGGHTSWGSIFMNLKDFNDNKNGYLVRNTCIIETHICVSDSAPIGNNIFNFENNNNLSSNIVTPINIDESLSDEQPIIEGEIRATDLTLRDLIDFHSLEPNLIPNLEEVCTRHPDLLYSQRNRTPGFRLWSFTSLGQVLHFLNTKKVKDISEDDVKYLKDLWEDLIKSSGFELAWLHPYVQSASGLKAHLEKDKKLRKLKDLVVGLEIKMKRLRGELAAAESQFEVARKELSEVRKGFQKMDVNSTIGYAMF